MSGGGTRPQQFVVLLRGVNVGSARKLPMAALRVALTAEGFGGVRTYIQSGNVVVDAVGSFAKAGPGAVADAVGRVTSGVAGFVVPVVVRSGQEWVEMMERNPYPVVDPTKVHVLFGPQGESMAEFEEFGDGEAGRFAPEAMTVCGTDVYLSLPNGMGVSKLAPALARLTPATTARNWRTVVALREMLEL